MDIYVGNLPFQIEESELRSLFESHGQVDRVKMIEDRETNRFKGFAFITMPNDSEANAAIQALNDQDIGGRPARVNEARKK